MNDNVIYLIIGLFFVSVCLVAIYFRNKYNRPIDYRAIFIIGSTFLPIGAGISNNTFIVLGIIFMIIGLNNKSKWNQNRIKWSDLSKEEKRFKITFLTFATLFILSTAVYYSTL